MTRTKEEIMAGMDLAKKKAEEELDLLLLAYTPEELSGIRKIMEWIDKWYLEAGYKRLIYSVRAKLK